MKHALGYLAIVVASIVGLSISFAMLALALQTVVAGLTYSLTYCVVCFWSRMQFQYTVRFLVLNGAIFSLVLARCYYLPF